MAIPKVIYQTFRDRKLPFITRWHVKNLRKGNPAYQYEFYDDARIEEFLSAAYDSEVLRAFKRIQIGAAKADFFRYAVLLKKGGVYLDMDSGIVRRLDTFILPEDVAVVSLEDNRVHYVQWALIYEANHPFLQKTMQLMMKNILENKYPHDVHSMTGPGVYSRAVRECLSADPSIPYRLMGVDYEGCLTFKYPLNKFLYKKGEHWKKAQQIKTVLK